MIVMTSGKRLTGVAIEAQSLDTLLSKQASTKLGSSLTTKHPEILKWQPHQNRRWVTGPAKWRAQTTQRQNAEPRTCRLLPPSLE